MHRKHAPNTALALRAGAGRARAPIGTPVEVTGASRPGTLVYNLWLSMQAKGKTDPTPGRSTT